jgi:type IV pilus assembly protein PilB
MVAGPIDFGIKPVDGEVVIGFDAVTEPSALPQSSFSKKSNPPSSEFMDLPMPKDSQADLSVDDMVDEATPAAPVIPDVPQAPLGRSAFGSGVFFAGSRFNASRAKPAVSVPPVPPPVHPAFSNGPAAPVEPEPLGPPAPVGESFTPSPADILRAAIPEPDAMKPAFNGFDPGITPVEGAPQSFGRSESVDPFHPQGVGTGNPFSSAQTSTGFTMPGQASGNGSGPELEPDDDNAPLKFNSQEQSTPQESFGEIVEDAPEKAGAAKTTLPAKPGHMLQRLIDSGSEAAAGPSSRLGDRLIARGWLNEEQLKVALQEKRMTGKMLGQVLVDLEFITDAQLSEILAEASGYDVFDAKNTIVDGDALALVTKEQAQKMQILPISMIDGEVMVAMVDPQDIVALDRLRRLVPKGMTVRPLMTTPSVITEAIDAAYGYSSDVESILAEMDSTNPDELAKLPETGVYTHPVVRLVNTLVAEAVKTGVSDLHWEPEENFVRLRYRLDGVLFTAQILHKKHWGPIAQRIKIMAGMNIADKLSPQDGRFELKFGPRSADFRVSVLPTVFGENIVMRVLDRTASILPLEKLGFSKINMEKIEWAQSRPEGIIIVTGPTGSGKSTSLYSMINAINNVQVNIQTLEDPVEYSLPMIRQTPVREGILDFADGIRALLRQDPDIIFIGEIRDGTTAEMALKAAMTGHQVYTTLHTNDSFGAIPRLLDLGLKPGMIAGAIIAVFAQRLARRLCPNCREEYQPAHEECRMMGFDPKDPPTIFRARQGGCQSCRGQGYKGRIALAEILTFDEELDEIIARSGTKGELRKRATEKGFKSMKDDAILKIREGITTFESAATCVDFTR